MKQLLKAPIKKALAAVNVFPTPLTDPGDMGRFIRSLQPVATDRDLIRLGPDADGGYLIPDDLDGIEACFSPGVSTVSGFEKDCADRGIKVFLADKSVEGPAESHELFGFTKKFVGAVSDKDFMTLDGWVNDSLTTLDTDLILQIDIEGAEYEVFLSASEGLIKRFRIIVAEFHWLEQLWSRPYFDLAKRAFDKILRDHTCVHIHPNNCCGSVKKAGLDIPSVMEFTFLRNDRIHRTSARTDFPHPLDRDNLPETPLVLPKCWFAA
jgi:hypothetical protein